MIEAIQHGIDQGLAVKGAIPAIVLDQVETGFRIALVIAVVRDEARQAFGMGRIANPGIEGHDVLCEEHRLVEASGGLQAFHQQPIERIGRRNSAADGAGLVGTRQAWIRGYPAEGLIEARATGSGGLVEVGRITIEGSGDHGGGEA